MVILLPAAPLPLETKIAEKGTHEFNGQETLPIGKAGMKNLCRRCAGGNQGLGLLGYQG